MYKLRLWTVVTQSIMPAENGKMNTWKESGSELWVQALMSRTRKLLIQISNVCCEICDIRLYSPTKKNHSPPSTCRTNKEPLPDKCEKDGTGYTHSTDNKKHARCEDLHNSLGTQTRHETLFLPSPPLPSSPSLTSSHSSSEASSFEPLTSSDALPSCLRDSNIGETMALSSSQKETKESLEEQDSRGGGLTCPDETSEWRSQNKVGMGDCLKSPKMGHWQHAEELELWR